MAMYQVSYEIKRGNQQDTKVVLVSAPNKFEAKNAVKTSEAIDGEYTILWHMDCKVFQDGEVFLVSSI